MAEEAHTDESQLWTLILGLASQASAGAPVVAATEIEAGPLSFVADPSAKRGWRQPEESAPYPRELRCMLDLYMPLCVGAQASQLVVAHLGQTLDGRIATHTGASQFITGERNLVHTHRMRALFDAVVVGAHTASKDNPRLTTRLTTGDHPTRVLLDPRCTVAPEASIFTDGAAPTLILCDEAHEPEDSPHTHIGLPSTDGLLACEDILAALRSRGLGRVFIEGGGVTVSKFLERRALHRLHVCVAPMIIGSGRPAFQLPQVDELGDGIFFECRHFDSGEDLLFDCQLRGKE